jgi:hypothetical protein
VTHSSEVSPIPRVLAIVKKPRRIHDLIAYAPSIAARLAADPVYASARPPLPVFRVHIAALEEADTVAASRLRGAAAARNGKLQVVATDPETLRSFLQSLADTHPAEGPALIERAGMSVKASSGHGKGLFELKPGAVPGAVHRYARAVRTRASYDGSYAIDEITWTRLESTVRADVVLPELTPGLRYFFRWRRVTRAGKGDWSRVVSFLVE